jgi:class 3 adenylate cyclase
VVITDPVASIAPVPPSGRSSTLLTFLIADVRGYTRFTNERGDEAAARLAARFAALARAAVTARGGEVIELRGDEALAVFGSARNAIRAALDLQARFAEATETDPTLPLPVGIGLDAGEPVPMEGGYRGGALNLAARLCSQAGAGEVLASAGVIHLARRTEGVVYIERGEVALKGLADPIRVVQIVTEASAALALTLPPEANLTPMVPPVERESFGPLPVGGYIGALPALPLVGRAQELERTLRAVTTAADARGQMVLIAGEAGVGKTRLVQEVSLALHERGFILATGRCYEPQESVPFYPFLDALDALYRGAPISVQSDISRRWPSLGRLIPDVGIPLPVSTLEGTEEQQRLFRAVAWFLGAVAAEIPVALVLDDLHWSDAASIDLLQHICRHTRRDRVLLIATYRDVELSRRRRLDGMLRDLMREQLIQRITLRRLEPAATAALVAMTLGESEQRPELAEFIHRRTEGNPYFIQQMVLELLERGEVDGTDAEWSCHAETDFQMPEGIRAVIGQRLARLSMATQVILKDASVLGQMFHFDDLHALAECTEGELEIALDEAERSGLIEEVGTDLHTFDHALTQAALYIELSSRRRRKLHGMRARSIDAWPEKKRAGAITQLAWHYMHAGRPQDAFPYVLAAGNEARTSFAYADAERQYDIALGLAEEIDDNVCRRQALVQRAQLYRDTYRGTLAVDDCKRALALARSTRDECAELEAGLDLARSYYLVALHTQAQDAIAQCREQYEAAVRLADRVGDFPSLVQALLETRWLQDFWPEYVPTARANRERALALSLEINDENLIMLSRLSLIRTRGRVEAETWGEDLEAQLTARGDLRRLNELHYHLMWANLQWGSLERCIAHCDAGFGIAAQIGVPPVQYGSLKALALTGLGRYGEALDALETEVTDDQHTFGKACRSLSLACLQLDVLAYERAAQTSRDAIEQARRVGRAWIEEWAQESLALALLRSGKTEEIDRNSTTQQSDLVLSEVLLAQGDLEAALKRSKAAAEGAQSMERTPVSVTALEVSARILLAMERWHEASSLCLNTLQITRAQGYRPMIWRLEAHRARALESLECSNDAEVARRTATEAIRELAGNIPDLALRREFMTSVWIRSIVGEV